MPEWDKPAGPNLGIVQVEVGQRDGGAGVEPEKREVGQVPLGDGGQAVLVAASVVEADEEVEHDLELQETSGQRDFKFDQ